MQHASLAAPPRNCEARAWGPAPSKAKPKPQASNSRALPGPWAGAGKLVFGEEGTPQEYFTDETLAKQFGLLTEVRMAS